MREYHANGATVTAFRYDGSDYVPGYEIADGGHMPDGSHVAMLRVPLGAGVEGYAQTGQWVVEVGDVRGILDDSLFSALFTAGDYVGDA